jgi:hypothetical protein
MGAWEMSYVRDDNVSTILQLRGSAFPLVGTLRRGLTFPHPSGAEKLRPEGPAGAKVGHRQGATRQQATVQRQVPMRDACSQ